MVIKKQIGQRLLSLLLVVSMIISWFSVPVAAADQSVDQPSFVGESELFEGFSVGDRELTEPSAPAEIEENHHDQGIEESEEAGEEKTGGEKTGESEHRDDDEPPADGDQNSDETNPAEGDGNSGETDSPAEVIEEPSDELLPIAEEEENLLEFMQESVKSRDELAVIVREALERSRQYYLAEAPLSFRNERRPDRTVGSSSNYWTFSAMWGAGIDLRTEVPWKEAASPWAETSFWKAGNQYINSTKELAGIIIGSLLLELDPRKFGQDPIPRDVVLAIQQMQDASTGRFSGDEFSHIWAMIALDVIGADYNRDAALSYLLSRQNSVTGSFNVADETGWTLIALAPYMDREDVQQAVKRAVEYVRNSRDADGEIADQMFGHNANSVAAIISGLVAVGEDLFSEEWTKNGHNLVEQFIARYQFENGAFRWKDTPDHIDKQDAMSTEQAVIAIGEVVEGKSVFQRLADYRKNVLEKSTRVAIRIEGREKTILSEQELRVESIAEKATILDALTQGLGAKQVSFEITASGEIKRIGEDVQGNPEEAGKWHVLVNGNKLVEDIYQYELFPNDELLLYYGNNTDLFKGKETSNSLEKLTLIPDITVLTKPVLAEKQLEIQISATYNEYDENNQIVNSGLKAFIEGATVGFNGKIYPTNKDGIARIPGEVARVGTYELTVTKDIENSYPRLLRSSQKISIEPDGSGNPENPGQGPKPPSVRGSASIAVHGPIGKGYLLAPTTLSIENGDTAYSVLERAMPGQVNSTGSGSSLYVRSIAGLGEFDYGSDSGWMYAVNGSFPNYSAGSYSLSDGDHVDWHYTTDLGKDIGGYIPGVEKGKGGAGSGPKPEEVRDQLSRLSIAANNQKPIHEVGTTVVVLNQDKRMSQQETEALQTRLKKHSFVISGSVSPTADGTLNDSEKEVILFVPTGAITKTTAFKIEKLKEHSFQEAISGVYDFSPAGATFKEPVQISVKTPLVVQNLEQLALVWWNEKAKQWIPIPAIVDAETGYVTGIVDHFTKFAVIDKTKLGIKVQGKHVSALENALLWIQQKEEWSEWDVIGLAQAGQKVPVQYLGALKAWLIEEQGEFRKVTDYQRIVLALTALGEDPHTFAGYNLIEKIYNNQRMTLQGINGPVFALIALDSKDYKIPENAVWTRDRLLQYIVENQKKDGGFSLSSKQAASDPDITAMVLQALTKYKQRPDVKQAIDQAVSWLASEQNKDGGYTNAFGEVNSESVAQVIIALSALGIDSDQDERFIKSEGSLLTNLLTYATSDGGFAHVHGAKSNDMATEQAVLALVAYDRFKAEQPSLYDLTTSEKQAELPFSDVGEISLWAVEAVQQAWEAKLMGGVSTENPRFEPKRALTRAEFAALLVQLMGEQETAEAPVFQDVSEKDWFYDSVSVTVAKGWMKGRSEHFFDPRGEVTREEIAVVIARLLALDEEGTAYFNSKAELSGYDDIAAQAKAELKDYEQISVWAQAGVSQVYQKEIMLGSGQSFMPQAKVTREMAAVLIMRLYTLRSFALDS